MNALGMIEVIGMTAAIAAADTAVKSANVTLLGYELAKGRGMVTIKFEGDVGAAKAALEAASMEAARIGTVVSQHLIPRPHKELEKLISPEEAAAESPSSEKEDAGKTADQPELIKEEEDKDQTAPSAEKKQEVEQKPQEGKQRGRRQKKDTNEASQSNEQSAVSVGAKEEKKG